MAPKVIPPASTRSRPVNSSSDSHNTSTSSSQRSRSATPTAPTAIRRVVGASPSVAAPAVKPTTTSHHKAALVVSTSKRPMAPALSSSSKKPPGAPAATTETAASATPTSTPPPPPVLFQTAEEAEAAVRELEQQIALKGDIQHSLVEELSQVYHSCIVQAADQVLGSLDTLKEREQEIRIKEAAARQKSAQLVAAAKARLLALQGTISEREAQRDAAMLIAKQFDNQRVQLEERCAAVSVDIQDAKQFLVASSERQKRMREEIDKHEGELLAIREGKKRTMESLDELRARVEEGQTIEAAAAAELHNRQAVIRQLESQVQHLQKLQKRKPGQPPVR